MTAMIYPIVKFGDPTLERPTALVEIFDDELRKLIEDMFASMYAAHGIGLAANQIGISKRLAVMDPSFQEDPAQKLVLVNPEVIQTEGRVTQEEGCLSIPGIREKISRPRRVTVRAQDARGNWCEKTGEDLLARALMHEIDHLDGMLFIRHVSALKRDLIKRKIKKITRNGQW